MFTISFSDGLAIAAVAISVVLVVLDKAGKLRGPTLFILLALACAMLVPLAVGNTWASEAHGAVRVFRSMLGCCIIATAYSLLSLWISTGEAKGNSSSEGNVPVAPINYSLNLLTPEQSALFVEDLEPSQSFYRFRITNQSGIDISDITFALDLPARLAKQPIIIDKSVVENLSVKPVFSAYTKQLPGKPIERVSGFSNSVIIDMSRIRPSGLVDIGLITSPNKPRQLVTFTGLDGGIAFGIAPAEGRYGSVSIRRRYIRNGTMITDANESFPINRPTVNAELIDKNRPLRAWSRSVFSLLTQDEILEAMEDHINIQQEQHFE